MSEVPAPVDFLKRRLLEIQRASEQALRELEGMTEVYAPRWRCVVCGYVKHFTRPACVKTAEGCPKCGGKSFAPVDDGKQSGSRGGV